MFRWKDYDEVVARGKTSDNRVEEQRIVFFFGMLDFFRAVELKHLW